MTPGSVLNSNAVVPLSTDHSDFGSSLDFILQSVELFPSTITDASLAV